jgi:hypothetical protein
MSSHVIRTRCPRARETNTFRHWCHSNCRFQPIGEAQINTFLLYNQVVTRNYPNLVLLVWTADRYYFRGTYRP